MKDADRAREALGPRVKRPCSCFSSSPGAMPRDCNDGLCKDAVDSITTALREAREEERAWIATHRHIKTGGLYRVVTRANMEADLAQVIVYDSEDGTAWVRPEAEFNDGRFEAIEARALDTSQDEV